MRRNTRVLPGSARLLLALAAAAPLLLAVPAATAQHGRTFRSAPKLTGSDIAILRKLVRQDLTDKPNGTTLPWSNPDSRNSGTVTLLDRFPSRGRDCRRVRYRIEPGPQQASFARPATYVLTSCQLSDGTWQLDKAAKPDTARQ